MESKKYFDNSDLNRLLLNWISNVSPNNPTELEREMFVDFSIVALEQGKYKKDIVMKALSENHPHISINENIPLMYEHYFDAIQTFYVQLGGDFFDLQKIKDKIIQELNR